MITWLLRLPSANKYNIFFSLFPLFSSSFFLVLFFFPCLFHRLRVLVNISSFGAFRRTHWWRLDCVRGGVGGVCVPWLRCVKGRLPICGKGAAWHLSTTHSRGSEHTSQPCPTRRGCPRWEEGCECLFISFFLFPSLPHTVHLSLHFLHI